MPLILRYVLQMCRDVQDGVEALRALRPLNSLAPCFVLAAGCAARDPVPVWVPLQDRARLARLLASGYAALDSRQTAGQETLLAMYPA